GDAATPESTRAVAAAAKKYDEHLTVQSMPQSATEQKISIAPAGAALAPRASGSEASVGIAISGPAAPIRIGGNIAQTKLLQKVNPAYPPEAKAARIQGLVRFEAIIDKAGTVKSINVVSGPPVLVQAAMQAVQQWVYQTTLLNGNPVEVATTIDVNFTLSSDSAPPPPPAQ
ncbi:MAG TPA: TonB family protein, partial [Bryobacteraceae bacterium]|nr:TonB family protein [Bryobacteraceae bacterium]